MLIAYAYDMQDPNRRRTGHAHGSQVRYHGLAQSDGSSLMTALDEQLGLKLESVRAGIVVLIIDSVEPPAPD
jgi:uncharacterized protein (TIGR03435 family)